jgi:hypothetical protein
VAIALAPGAGDAGVETAGCAQASRPTSDEAAAPLLAPVVMIMASGK